MSGFLANFPFFAHPFLNKILEMFVDKAMVFLVTDAEMRVFFVYIDLRVGSQKASFDEAARENYIAQQSGTPEEKKRAEEKLCKAFAALAVLTN